jgi:hypothetical protein
LLCMTSYLMGKSTVTGLYTENVRFIVSPSTAALSHWKLTSADTCCDFYGARGHAKRDTVCERLKLASSCTSLIIVISGYE